MIRVRCLGHIGTSVGMKEVTVRAADIGADELVEMVRAMATGPDPGFTKFNTLVVVGEGEAFVPASVKRTVADGDTVVLVPVSHGG